MREEIVRKLSIEGYENRKGFAQKQKEGMKKSRKAIVREMKKKK